MIRIIHTHIAKPAIFLVIGLLAVLPARAGEPLTPAQTVIESQIEAFLTNDMAKAYSYAAPDIKTLFPTEEKFGEMVRNGYGPVYRPGNYAFGRARETAGGGVVQEVLISGPKNTDWTAIYIMERQSDGSMKIRGVSMMKSETSGI